MLLVGNASQDPREFLPSETNLDLVPTRLINTNAFQASSDGWFADFQNNSEPQMAIGRLPVQSAAEVTTLVNKIIAYDRVTQGQKVLLTADASDSSPTFAVSSDALKGLLPTGATVTAITRAGDDSNHPTLIGALNGSPDLVNYIGHGNNNSWGGNDGWFSNTDAATLTNSSHPAFFALMTCLNGQFADPNQASLGEALLRAMAVR